MPGLSDRLCHPSYKKFTFLLAAPTASNKCRVGTNKGTCPFISPGLKADNNQKFADDPDKYLEVFLNLTPVLELTQRDVLLLLNQTQTGGEKDRVIKTAQEKGDEWYAVNAWKR